MKTFQMITIILSVGMWYSAGADNYNRRDTIFQQQVDSLLMLNNLKPNTSVFHVSEVSFTDKEAILFTSMVNVIGLGICVFTGFPFPPLIPANWCKLTYSKNGKEKTKWISTPTYTGNIERNRLRHAKKTVRVIRRKFY